MSSRVEVFNSQMELIGYVSLAHAIKRICQGKAWSLRSDPNQQICCATFCLPAPLAIQTHGPQLRPRRPHPNLARADIPLNHKEWQCVYCGRTEDDLNDTEYFNRDHIIPKSRGGGTKKNLVLSCDSCNRKKGSRTPIEAGLRQPVQIWVPTKAELRQHRERRERRLRARQAVTDPLGLAA